MRTEWWPVDRPAPYPDNPRDNAHAVGKVASSLKEFGWQQPIVVDRDGVVIVGHTRLLAAKQLGYTKVPVQVAAELTPAQARAYRIADNRTHEEATWDTKLLALEIEELTLENYDPLLTGFDEEELSDLFAPLDEDVDAEEDTSAAAPTERLKLEWADQAVDLTPQEAADLTERFQNYLKATGLAYGFARSLLVHGPILS